MLLTIQLMGEMSASQTMQVSQLFHPAFHMQLGQSDVSSAFIIGGKVAGTVEKGRAVSGNIWMH